jgi:uncharacterized RDD family membrane protein YckC/type II secretory pathway pseudopilin PulG
MIAFVARAHAVATRPNGDRRMADWYYVDATGGRAGPVDEGTLAAALHGGSVGAATLAWRDGMAGWQPLGELPEFGGAPRRGGPPPLVATLPGVRDSEGDVVPAGFIRRGAALFLDQLVLVVPSVVIVLVLTLAFGVQEDAKAVGAFDVLNTLACLVVSAIYFAAMESSAWQATLGKRALGIKVADMDGRRIGFPHALGRWLAAALSYLTLLVGFLMAAFTERKRALHDYVAGTQVVDAWAYTDFPERQKRGLSGCLVAFLVAMALVPILAILAAIAISQYQDYVLRAQVTEASSLADGVKQAMTAAYERAGHMPESNAAAGLPDAADIQGAYVASVDIGREPGRIEAVFSSHPPHKANAALDGKHLWFRADVGAGSIIWSCSSPDLKQKHCPSSCDCSG